jgi:hypothetical protein
MPALGRTAQRAVEPGLLLPDAAEMFNELLAAGWLVRMADAALLCVRALS